MGIYVEGQRAENLPCLTREEKLRKLNEMCQRFWKTPLYAFWRNVYISFRDGKKNKKAGKSAPTDNPASDNHDGKPAA